jgi:hypothetical protein
MFYGWIASLEQLRVLLMELFEEIEPLQTGIDMKPSRRVVDLVRVGKIPRRYGPMFKTLIEIRNNNHYNRRIPRTNEVEVIKANLAAIIEWGEEEGLTTATELRRWTLPQSPSPEP